MVKAQINGPKGVRRRVPPNMLFGERLVKTAPISQVFFLVRCPVLGFQQEDVLPRRLADICTHVILAEYSHYINYLRYWEATGFAPITVEILRANLSDTYERAFAQAMKCQLIRIPVSATPAMLEEFIVKVIEDA